MRCGALSLLPMCGRSSAPHPAEPEPPSARAELSAVRSAARSAAASGRWKLCYMRRGALTLLTRGRSSAPHPAEPEPPSARAERRALRSAARSAAASCRWKLCSMRCGALPLLLRGRSSAPHPAEPEPPSARADLRALRNRDLEILSECGFDAGRGFHQASCE
jgi:hypothetical protein